MRTRHRHHRSPTTRRWTRPLTILVAAVLLYRTSPVDAGERGAVGDLYVTCLYANKVVQFDGQTGALVGDFVTPGSGGLDRPFGLAWGGNGNLLVVSEGYGSNAGIVEYDGTTGAFVRWVVGPGDAQTAATGWLNRPSHVAVGRDGNLYVTGQWNSAVLKYDGVTGEWLGTFAIGGLPNGGLRFPQDLTFGPNGHLFVISGYEADNPTGEGRGICEYHPTTGRLVRVVVGDDDPRVHTPLSASLLFRPNGNLLLTSSDLDLVTGETDGNEVLEFDGATGELLGAFVPEGSALDRGTGMAYGPNGNLFVASANTLRVLEYDGQTGAFIRTFVGSGLRAYPMDLAFKPAPPAPTPAPIVTGVSSSAIDACAATTRVTVVGANLDPAATVVKLAATGEPDLVGGVVGGTAAALEVDFDLGAGIAGGTRDVVVVNPDGQTAALASAVTVTPCWTASEAHLFVLGNRHRANHALHGLFEFDGASGDLIGVVAEDQTVDVEELYLSSGFAFAYDGHLLITSHNPHDPVAGHFGSVLEYDGLTGEKLGTFIPAGTGGLLRPKKLTFGPNGNLFVLHTGVSGAPSGVLEFDGLTGAFARDFVPLATCGLEYASDLAFGPEGHLYVTDKVTGVFAFDGVTGECRGGNVLIPDPSGGPGGERFEALGFTRTPGHLLLPWGVDDAPWGRITAHERGSGVLLDTPIPPGLGAMHAAACATTGPNGHLYVKGYPDAILEYDVAEGTYLGVLAQQTNVLGNADAYDLAFRPAAGDADADWDLDLRDFAAFQRCFTGGGVLPPDPTCLALDHDRDGDVDATDLARFGAALTGPR